jgi:hypothetical protein
MRFESLLTILVSMFCLLIGTLMLCVLWSSRGADTGTSVVCLMLGAGLVVLVVRGVRRGLIGAR